MFSIAIILIPQRMSKRPKQYFFETSTDIVILVEKKNYTNYSLILGAK